MSGMNRIMKNAAAMRKTSPVVTLIAHRLACRWMSAHHACAEKISPNKSSNAPPTQRTRKMHQIMKAGRVCRKDFMSGIVVSPSLWPHGRSVLNPRDALPGSLAAVPFLLYSSYSVSDLSRVALPRAMRIFVWYTLVKV